MPVCAVLLLVVLAGCGEARQDADEPEGEFTLQIVDAKFPAKQTIAQPARMRLTVRNTDDREIPNLAVTVETDPGTEGKAPTAFGQAGTDTRLADANRPVWIVDREPEGGGSAYTNTWAVGRLAAGQTRTVRWRLTAVKAGRYTVAWRLEPSLEVGDATLGDGRTAGEFSVTIADAPVPAGVDRDGNVVRGEAAGR